MPKSCKTENECEKTGRGTQAGCQPLPRSGRERKGPLAGEGKGLGWDEHLRWALAGTVSRGTGTVSITHVAASSLSHEVCREVTAFFSPSDGDGGGGKTERFPADRLEASRCLRAWGCTARPKDRRVRGHSAEPPTTTPGQWILVPASHPLPSPLLPPWSPWVWLQALGNETFPSEGPFR